MNDHLTDTLNAILKAETAAVALFIPNPASQELAMTAIVGETVLFGWIEQLHTRHAGNTAVPAVK